MAVSTVVAPGRRSVLHIALAHEARDVRIFEKEARTLAEAGYQIGLAAVGSTGGSENGVRICPLPLAASARGIGAAPRRIWATFKAVAALRPTLIHLHEPELIPLGIVLARRGVRVIYDAHEDAPIEAKTLNRHRPWRGEALSLVWRANLALARRAFDGFVAATPEIAGKLPADRTVLVRNFPRLERLRPGPLAHADRPRRIAYVGSISRARGLFNLLDALAGLPASDPAELMLVGSFQPPDMLAEAERHPGWARVRYSSWRPWSEISKILDSCRIGICALHPTPEMLRSLPVKLFEYLAKGLPVIASDFPDWRDIVGQAGVLIDPLDTNTLRVQIVRMLDDPQAGEAMGREGVSRVNVRFSWSSEAEQLLALYDRVIGPPPRD